MKKIFKNPICTIILILGLLSCAACSDKTEKSSETEKKAGISRNVPEEDGAVTYNEADVKDAEEETETTDGVDIQEEAVENSSQEEPDKELVIPVEETAETSGEDTRYDSGELGRYMSKNEGWISVLFGKMFSAATGGYTCECSFSAKGGVLTVNCMVNELDNLTDREKEEAFRAYNSKMPEMTSKLKIAKAEVPSLESVVICVYDKDGDLIISDTVTAE